MDDLIDRLRLRLGDPEKVIARAGEVEPRVFPPATEDELRAAEDKLGFALPKTLRSIYAQVANGGIGPGFGLLGLAGGATDDRGSNAVELYCEFLRYNDSSREEPSDQGDSNDDWNWPAKMLPICYHGCTVYECLDCSLPDPPVCVVDVGDQEWDQPFEQTAPSLRAWLEAWLDETDLPEPQWLRWLDDGEDFRTITWAGFGGEMFASQMPYLARLTKLTGLGLTGPRITDDHLAQLVHVPQLEALHLHGANISDDGLRHVAALCNLRHLFLGETPISDAGLVRLQNLPLETLDLNYTAITDEGLRHLYSIRTLQRLSLTSVPVTRDGVAALKAELPECEVEWRPSV